MEMTWQSVINTLLIGIAFVAVTLFVSWLKGRLAKWTKSIDNPIINQINEKINDYLDAAIDATNKDFVDKLKELGLWDKVNGIFDKETYENNKAESKLICYNKLISFLPKSFKETISKFFNSIEDYLQNQIERRMKERELAKLNAQNNDIIEIENKENEQL